MNLAVCAMKSDEKCESERVREEKQQAPKCIINTEVLIQFSLVKLRYSKKQHFARNTNTSPIEQNVCRTVPSNRQTEPLASVISFVFVFYSHHKHPKYTQEGNLTTDIASVIIFH